MNWLRARVLIVHEATAAFHIVIPGVILVVVADVLLKMEGVI